VDSHVPGCPPEEGKNDSFAAGMTLHLGATGEALCPVSSMLGYLAIFPSTLFQDGSPLSRPRLVKSLRQALGSLGWIVQATVDIVFGLGQ